MKNMRKILITLTSLNLTIGSTISVAACSCTIKNQLSVMDNQILQDLEIYDNDNKSVIKPKIDGQGDDLSWTVEYFDIITATKLLKDGEKTPKSEVSYNFLKSNLKVKESETGETWEDKTFNTEDTDKITLNVVTDSIKPTVVATEDNSDFQTTGGVFHVQWKDAESNDIDKEYEVNLGSEEALDVKSSLPDLVIGDFNDKFPFKIGKDATIKPDSVINGDTLSSSVAANKLNDLKNLINQGDLKLVVSEVSKEDGKYEEGNELKFKISIGEIALDKEYTLTLQKVVIDVDNADLELDGANQKTREINNFAELTDFALIGNVGDFFTAENHDGTLTFTGKANGESNLEVRASNADTVIIKVKVTGF